MQHQPSDDSPDQPVEARWVTRVWVDERIERGGDKRPVFRTGVLLWRRWVRSPAAGLGARFGVQVGQMLGADEHRSARIAQMRKRGAPQATTQMARMGAEDAPSIRSRTPTR